MLKSKINIKMTQEELIKHWELIEGVKNGKELEYFDPHIQLWRNIENPSFDINCEYRFKQEPEYIPFDFSDAKDLIGKTLRTKNINPNSYYALISKADLNGVVMGSFFYDYNALLDQFTFVDGSICGKLC